MRNPPGEFARSKELNALTFHAAIRKATIGALHIQCQLMMLGFDIVEQVSLDRRAKNRQTWHSRPKLITGTIALRLASRRSITPLQSVLEHRLGSSGLASVTCTFRRLSKSLVLELDNLAIAVYRSDNGRPSNRDSTIRWILNIGNY